MTEPRGKVKPYDMSPAALKRAQEQEDEEWAAWEAEQAAKVSPPTITSVTVGGEPVRQAPDRLDESDQT